MRIRRVEQAVGLGLFALLAVHAWRSEEGAWVLLWGCDLGALEIAFGLLAGWHLPVAVGFLYLTATGLPSYFVGLLTATYEPTVTSVAIHLLPPLIGGFAVARKGLPRYVAALAIVLHAAVMAASLALPPAWMNVNWVRSVWPPLARFFSSTSLGYHALMLTWLAVLFCAGEAMLRRLVRTPVAAAGESLRARTAPASHPR